MNPSIIRNVRPLGGPMTDLCVADGRYASGPPEGGEAAVLDGRGLLALPGFVEAHTHLDKNLIGMPWFRNEIGPTRFDRIEADRREKKRLGIDPRRQAERQIRQTAALGTTVIRSHVDVDTEIGTANVAGVLEARGALGHLATVQIVAFPQSGLLVRPGTLPLLEDALRMGADVVGGLDPAAIDRDPVAHLDAVFGLADRFGKPVDIHLHEPGELGLFSLELIVERTRALGLLGRVMVSHAYCLGAIAPDALDRITRDLADLRIAVMTAGPPGVPCPSLKRLREAGVTLCGGSDGPRGTWSPYGRGDMLQRAGAIAERNGFTRDVDLDLAFAACTENGAGALGLADHGLGVGCPADLVLVEAETVAEAVASVPPRRLVMRHGRVVFSDLPGVAAAP